MHFPVAFGGKTSEELLAVLKKHGIKRCYYGHIHGTYDIPASFVEEDVTFTLVSADFLDFVPKIVN
jgi:predicted phosphohydrolase